MNPNHQGALEYLASAAKRGLTLDQADTYNAAVKILGDLVVAEQARLKVAEEKAKAEPKPE